MRIGTGVGSGFFTESQASRHVYPPRHAPAATGFATRVQSHVRAHGDLARRAAPRLSLYAWVLIGFGCLTGAILLLLGGRLMAKLWRGKALQRQRHSDDMQLGPIEAALTASARAEAARPAPPSIGFVPKWWQRKRPPQLQAPQVARDAGLLLPPQTSDVTLPLNSATPWTRLA